MNLFEHVEIELLLADDLDLVEFDESWDLTLHFLYPFFVAVHEVVEGESVHGEFGVLEREWGFQF